MTSPLAEKKQKAPTVCLLGSLGSLDVHKKGEGFVLCLYHSNSPYLWCR